MRSSSMKSGVSVTVTSVWCTGRSRHGQLSHCSRGQGRRACLPDRLVRWPRTPPVGAEHAQGRSPTNDRDGDRGCPGWPWTPPVGGGARPGTTWSRPLQTTGTAGVAVQVGLVDAEPQSVWERWGRGWVETSPCEGLSVPADASRANSASICDRLRFARGPFADAQESVYDDMTYRLFLPPVMSNAARLPPRNGPSTREYRLRREIPRTRSE
jgi:hypothetical protein